MFGMRPKISPRGVELGYDRVVGGNFLSQPLAHPISILTHGSIFFIIKNFYLLFLNFLFHGHEVLSGCGFRRKVKH